MDDGIPGLDVLLAALDAGSTVTGDSPLHAAMHRASQEAMRVTAELNGSYHEPDEVRALLSRLVGADVPASVTVFPPLHSDFGRNLHLGERVFVNSGCHFQDQGGIRIGDDCLIGHNVVIATLNHGLDPARPSDLVPDAVTIGRNVWIGANATILPGVTIGEDAVVGAGSVVIRDVPAGSVVVGSPARVVRTL
ncbi:sugar O-acetyltransferase [Nocardioides bruguierae]|uniref:Sugar O-acetyltransferase n=1 Tax=Nocardioides bruguierae TaxID=2945102 RepID=A0A9X2DDH7_9ACTN|nr:sugar O-acetyltransferase [Nocardioides bruguierae]MCM0622484.1 sugar O-acetyltransferase [Nocardioides bruguierae]